MLLTFVVVFIFGIGLEQTLLRPLRKEPSTSSMLMTMGLSIVLQNAALLIWGGEVQTVPPIIQASTLSIGDVVISTDTVSYTHLDVYKRQRLRLAEKVAIEMCISFAEYSGARMHVVHMSTGVGAILIKEAKKRGLKVTAETCPHYLLLNAEESMGKWGSFAKIAPPLRYKEDNDILWEHLQNLSLIHILIGLLSFL